MNLSRDAKSVAELLLHCLKPVGIPLCYWLRAWLNLFLMTAIPDINSHVYTNNRMNRSELVGQQSELSWLTKLVKIIELENHPYLIDFGRRYLPKRRDSAKISIFTVQTHHFKLAPIYSTRFQWAALLLWPALRATLHWKCVVLHDDINCNAIKVEPIDFNNGTAMADHLDLFVATEQDVKEDLLESLTFAGDIAEVDLSSIALDPLGQAPVQRIMSPSHRSFVTEQPKWRQYRCPKCNAQFANKSNVNRHKKMCTGIIERRTHGQPRQYHCPYCQVRVANASNLNRHRKTCAVRRDEPSIARVEPASPKAVLEEGEGNAEQESKTTTNPSHEERHVH